jgi:hypothetical protein
LGADSETASPARLDKIDGDVTGRFEQIFINEILHAAIGENAIRFCRLIQSQGQGRTASPAFLQENPHPLRRVFFLIQDLFDPLVSSLSCRYHIISLSLHYTSLYNNPFFPHFKIRNWQTKG